MSDNIADVSEYLGKIKMSLIREKKRKLPQAEKRNLARIAHMVEGLMLELELHHTIDWKNYPYVKTIDADEFFESKE